MKHRLFLLLRVSNENLVLFHKCTKMHVFALSETGHGTGQKISGNVIHLYIIQHYLSDHLSNS